MYRKSLSAVAVVGVLAVGAMLTGAAAAPPLSVASPSAHAPSGAKSSGPLDKNDPAVKKLILQHEKRGETFVGGSTASYLPVSQASGTATLTPKSNKNVVHPDSLPSGCGLSVLIFKTGSYMVSDNLTSCHFSYASAYMDSGIYFWAWLNWGNEVKSDSAHSYAEGSFTMDYRYRCVNSNNTDFQTQTIGEVTTNGETYQAEAYDEADGQKCGTS